MKRAALADTLVILIMTAANNGMQFHGDAIQVLHILYGRQYRKIGIPFAATGTAYLAYTQQGFARHHIGLSPWLFG